LSIFNFRKRLNTLTRLSQPQTATTLKLFDNRKISFADSLLIICLFPVWTDFMLNLKSVCKSNDNLISKQINHTSAFSVATDLRRTKRGRTAIRN
jgi:hypothetical protein